MDKRSIEIARSFAGRLRKKIKVNKLILFGSRARGDHLANSDYDFIIVSEYFKNKRFIFRAAEIYDYWEAQEDIEPICYTSEEFERKKKQIGLVKEAIKDGIEL